MRVRQVAFALASAAGLLQSQAAPGTNLRVTVTIANLTRVADTVSIAYRLTNAAASVERVGDFFVETPSPAIAVVRPLPFTHWVVASKYGDRPVASWGILDPTILIPGTTGPDLSFKAIGIPGIVDAHVIGDHPPPELREDSLRAEPDPLLTNAIHFRVVGVVAADPSASAPALVSRLGVLLAESCSLGWVSNAGVCQSLQAKIDAASSALQRGDLGAATNQLNALINELNAQRGKQVDDNAYFLLRTNAEYVVSRI